MRVRYGRLQKPMGKVWQYSKEKYYGGSLALKEIKILESLRKELIRK